MIYTCAHCHEDFVSDWTDEEAMEEAEGIFDGPLKDAVAVCDDCFVKFMKWYEGLSPEEKRVADADAYTETTN